MPDGIIPALKIELGEFRPIEQNDLALGLADKAQYVLVVKHG
jgi:hypothetical protein